MTSSVSHRYPAAESCRIEELTQQFAQRTDKPVHAFEDFRDAYDFCRRAKGDVGTLLASQVPWYSCRACQEDMLQ